MHRALEREDRAAARARCRRGGTSPGRRPAPSSTRARRARCPRCSTAIGPSSILKPLNIGPVQVNLPSASAVDRELAGERHVAGHAGRLAELELAPCGRARPRAPASPTSRSISRPSTASRGSRSSSAASRPVVSPLPPAPGLSCVSASTTGAPGSPRCAARATASSGVEQLQRELGLGVVHGVARAHRPRAARARHRARSRTPPSGTRESRPSESPA